MRWLIVISLALPGCFVPSPDACGDGACTALFAMITVKVVDADGLPANDLTTRSVHVATGDVIRTSPFPNDQGLYVVVDDNFLGQILGPAPAHDVRFEVLSSTLTADFSIQASECDCHVEKLQGPDVLMLP